MKKDDRGTIKGMHLLRRICPPNGFKVTHAKTKKLHKKRREIYGNSSLPKKHPKVVCIDNSLDFGKSFEHLQWNHSARLHLIGQREIELQKEQQDESKREGTSSILLQSGLDEQRRTQSAECDSCLRIVQDLLI